MNFVVSASSVTSSFPTAAPSSTPCTVTIAWGWSPTGLSCLQHEKIDGSGLAHFFDVIVVAGDLGIAKPDPRVFDALLDPLQVTADEAVMVGNSVMGDIGGAQNVGIKAVLIHRGEIHGQDDSIIPDRTIADLSELTDYLNELNA